MPTPRDHVPELLAPAGGDRALRAAVAAGADAVYLGLGELNARRGAENFTRETLPEACRFAHLHGVSVFLTANVVILPHEMADALSLVDFAWSAGVDAVIVQDLGLLRVIRSALPHVRLHASTQMNTHSSDSIRALGGMGVSRVTLARETAFGEISQLVSAGREVGVEVESFVHGALCMCYSGQCLLSSMVGGRSANRGLCAQPCRLPYELIDEAGTVLSDVGSYLLSPKDLAAITVLPEFVEAGVSALKIEGRMKSPEYVALVTGVYRGALDRAAQTGESYEVREGELSVLSEAFSRGFTEAYLIGERGKEMMSYLRPSNRGVPVGRVAKPGKGRATIALDVPVDAEDTVEFWTSSGRFAQRVGPMEFGGRVHTGAPAGARVDVAVEGAVGQGDRVFRVRNAALSEAARRLFESHGPEITLAFRVRVSIGDPLLIEVVDQKGRRAKAEGDVVEAARTRPVSAEEVMEHVGRLGNTPYEASSWDVELSPNAGLGFSALHALRRKALAEYEREVLRSWADRRPASASLPALQDAAEPPAAVTVVAVVTSMEAAHACLDAGADEAHLPAWAFEADGTPGIVPVVPRVCHDAEAEGLYAPARRVGRAVAGTLGALWRLAGEGVSTQAHWSLNALNAYAVAQLADAGASLVWLSPELTARQIAEVTAGAAVPVGVGIVGRQELMVTEHCILTSEGPCAENCAACSRRTRTRWLKDRKGYRFPVVTDPTGRSHLYNSVRLDATNALPDLLAAGVAALRLDLETEGPREAAAEVAHVRAALDAALAGRPVAKPTDAVTTGHLYRGVR